jgi:hypothetical protein
VAFCRVSYRDADGIEHAVELEGESLYEAVARAVNRFRRDDGWCMDPPGSACQLCVKVLKDTPITYMGPSEESSRVRAVRHGKRPLRYSAKEENQRILRLD